MSLDLSAWVWQSNCSTPEKEKNSFEPREELHKSAAPISYLQKNSVEKSFTLTEKQRWEETKVIMFVFK